MKFNAYQDYFFTADKKGMADYSNANFVTQDTNYDDYANYSNPLTRACFRFDSPKESDATSRVDYVSERVLANDGTCCITVPNVLERVLTSNPYDAQTGAHDVDTFHDVLSSVDLEAKRYVPGATFYSLADSSYQTRAALLIPRAVGYSAGFIDHLFRGKIEVSWEQRAPGGDYQVTITNRSAEKIGADARFTANFVAPPAYFGRTTSDDTWRIFDGPLADYLMNFNGINPGQSVALTVSRPSSLAPGDDLNAFERRIAVTGSLGAETGEVIGLVQPAGKGHDLTLTVKGSLFNVIVAYSQPPSYYVNTEFGNDTFPDSSIIYGADNSVTLTFRNPLVGVPIAFVADSEDDGPGTITQGGTPIASFTGLAVGTILCQSATACTVTISYHSP